jgi:hypothetical protein
MDCLKNTIAILLCLGAISWAGSPRSADGADDPPDRPPIAATAGDAGGVAIERGQDAPANAGFTDRQIAGLIASLTIFVLAIFVGFEVITKVPPTLHTPLMSGSNAISGITLVGSRRRRRCRGRDPGYASGHHRGRPRNDQCRRRFSGDSPDAADVPQEVEDTES